MQRCVTTLKTAVWQTTDDPAIDIFTQKIDVSENRSVNWLREYSDLKTLPFRFLLPLFWLISFSRKDIKQTRLPVLARNHNPLRELP